MGISNADLARLGVKILKVGSTLPISILSRFRPRPGQGLVVTGDLLATGMREACYTYPQTNAPCYSAGTMSKANRLPNDQPTPPTRRGLAA